MITNGFTYMAVLIFIAAMLVTLEAKTKWKVFNILAPVVLLYITGMLLCTLNVWDLEATTPIYSSIKNPLTYAMVFTMLLRCDLRKVLKLGPKMLIGFFAGSFSIMVGFILAYFIMKPWLGGDAWMGLGALAGSWIGGSGNMIAVQAALNVPEKQMAYAIACDSFCGAIWIAAVLALRQAEHKFNKWTKADTSRLEEISAGIGDTSVKKREINFQSIILLLGLAFVVSAVGTNVGVYLNGLLPFFDKATWTVLFITVIGLGFALTPLSQVPGTGDIANLLLYIVVALMASRASLSNLKEAPVWILAGAFILLLHVVVMALVSKLFKIDLFTASVASMANVGGTASAPVVAGNFSGTLVPIAVLMALLGYIVGSPLALITARIMQAL